MPARALLAALSPGADVVTALGARIRAHWDVDRAVLLGSGTSALRLAIEGAPGAGPPVVALPGWGCYDLASAAIGAAARVELYDLDPQALAPDLDSVRQVLSRGITALVLVHPFGLPRWSAELVDLAAASGATLIEDAAQGAGGTWSGRPLGGLGEVGVLSLGRGKGWTAGRGGVLLARGPAWSDRADRVAAALPPPARGVADLPALAAQWLLARPSVYGIPAALPFLRLGETVYRPPGPVTSVSRVAAAVGQVTLPLQEAEAAQRRRHAEAFERVLERCGQRPAPGPAGGTRGALRFPVLLPPGRVETAPGLGVLRSYPVPLQRLPALVPFLGPATVASRLPGSEALAERLVTLPTHGGLTAADLAQVERWLASCFSESVRAGTMGDTRVEAE